MLGEFQKILEKQLKQFQLQMRLRFSRNAHNYSTLPYYSYRKCKHYAAFTVILLQKMRHNLRILEFVVPSRPYIIII